MEKKRHLAFEKRALNIRRGSSSPHALPPPLKNTQDSINISTIYVPPAFSINTTVTDNIRKTADNVIIAGGLSVKYTGFNCTKIGRWVIALKKALYNADLFIADNSIPTRRDS